MRRDSSDKEWRQVKKRIKSRDNNKDRLLRVLTVKEALILQKNASKAQLNKLDAAHIYPVSTHPGLVYEDCNIVLLNRYSHENLDNCRCPLTGNFISMEERNKWWERICGESQWRKLHKALKNRKP